MTLAGALVTVLGLGHLRPAPGTWGSTPPPLLALGAVWLLGRDGLTATDVVVVNGALVALGALFAVACVRYGAYAEARFGSKDPGQVVADEVAGQVVALLFLPWVAMVDGAAVRHDLALAAVAFIAFRVMDILKPPPANALQRLPGGWGILVDDLVAGVYALALTQAAARMLL